MPDDELFRAAESGALSQNDTLRTQVRRMIEDPRARGMVESFHHQLLDWDKYADVTRPFPEFTTELRASMQGEAREFVSHVVFTERSGLATLLTAPYTFADARLAQVYGLAGTFPADGFRQVQLDPTRRAGLFTQIGFLAAYASGADTDPIHRGVFINLRVLCARLPPPPQDVPPLPPATGMVTMRQRIEAHTGAGTCGATCHGTMINPIGFAYEHYDALGRWRDLDNGLPVNAADQYSFEGEVAAYDGAVQLAREMATRPMAHNCYARNWMEYTYARQTTPSDQPVVTRVGGASRERQLPVLDIITELVTSRAFLTRSTQELAL
jgi:hypothetical protein